MRQLERSLPPILFIFIQVYFTCNLLKYFLNIYSGLCWAFEMLHISCDLLSFFYCDFPILFQINFVCNQDYRYFIDVYIVFDLCEPIGNISDTLPISAIIYEYNSLSSIVIGWCDRPEPFMAHGVPNL